MSGRVGVYRAALAFRFWDEWRVFLDALGFEPVLAPATTKATLDTGIRVSPPELCLPIKAAIGQVKEMAAAGLKVLLPRFVSRRVGRRFYFGCPKYIGFPDMVRKSYGLPEQIELCWLTRTGHPGALRPDHVPELAQRVQRFLSPGNGLVLLDGLDILVAENGFTEFYRILSHIKDLTRLTKGILLVVVPPGSLSPDEFRKLSQDAEVV